MIKGTAGQVIGAQLYDASGNPFAGVAHVYVDGDHTGQVIGSVGAGLCFARGNGYYDYLVGAADVNYTHIGFTFVPTGGLNVTIQIETITPAQVSALQSATGLSSVTVNQLLLEAFIECKAGRAADQLEPELLIWALGKLNRLFDKWNADPSATYTVGFTSYTPTVNHAPHTLGPNSADWTVAQRPDKIRGANLILNTVSPAVRIPIQIRDDRWWLNQAVQGLATAIVTDLYYEPNWPNGSVNLWPIPTTTYPIELMTDTLFGNLTMTDTLWLPYGYREAATLTLAELLAPGTVDGPVSQDLKQQARDARVTAFGNNNDARNIRTRDGGMPGGRRRGGGYSYRTGRIR